MTRPRQSTPAGARRAGAGRRRPLALRLAFMLGALALVCASAARALPDGRAYEQVTPPEKNGADVGGPTLEGLLANASGQGAASGDAIAYVSLTSFGDAQSAEIVTQYVSTRGPAGWSTHAITPPVTAASHIGLELSPFHFFTSDLSAGVLDWRQPYLTDGAPQGFDNLYVRDADGTYRLVTSVMPSNVAPAEYRPSFEGASADLGHVVFEANDALAAGAPARVRSVYEWTGSAPRLVSVLPGAAGVATSAGAGDGQDDGFPDAISSDGARIFWTDGERQLYVREDAVRTVKLNASRRAVSLGDGSATLRAATPAGSKAFFTDEVALTDEAGDAGGGLYEYDLEDESLRDLTPDAGANPEVQGLLGVGDDGSSVYFVARAVLAAGAGEGAANLYLARAGQIRFIATLSGEDEADYRQRAEGRLARVTPDGLHAAFLSKAPLTEYDNADALTGAPDSELYIYDARDGSIACVSCDPSGAPPVGSAKIPSEPGEGGGPGYEPRILSPDGSRAFFDSPDALLPADGNGQQDVYEYDAGSLSLISSGTSGDISALVDTSAHSRDVFFTTRSRLVAADRDESADLYDARVGGGFAIAPEALACAGEACRGPLAASFAAPSAATALFTEVESAPVPVVSKPAKRARASATTKVKRSKRHRGKRAAKARRRAKAKRRVKAKHGVKPKHTASRRGR